MTPDDFTAFHARHHDQVLRACWAYCGDREVAEDAVQDAFVRASRDWRKVSRMSSPGGWLHRVAVNRVNDHFRRAGVRRRSRERHGVEDAAVAPVDAASMVAVREAVAALPDDQRLAVALYYFADLSVAGVARVMDAPEGTVKSWLHRGREALRAHLDDEHTTSTDEENQHVR